MAEPVPVGLEYAVGGKEAQDAFQGIRMGAHRCRQLLRRSRVFPQGVRDAEIGDDVEASRHHVPARDLQDRDDRVCVFQRALLLPQRGWLPTIVGAPLYCPVY